MSKELNETSSLEDITDLLKTAIKLFEEDRQMAIDNYEMFKEQLGAIKDDYQMSDGGQIEKETNNALRMVYQTGERFAQIVRTVERIMTTQMINDSKERMVSIAVGGAIGLGGKQATPLGVVDIKALMDETNKNRENK